MAAIPTILKGDDSGSVTLTLATGRTYDGATLYATYQNVTRTFTNLTAGGSVTLAFTDEETARFALGCYPVTLKLVGSAGAVETVDNAGARIRVTDCVGEINAGGSFVITPTEQGTAGKATKPSTGTLGTDSSMDDIITKVNTLITELKS